MTELSELVLQIKDTYGWKNESRIVGEACEDYLIQHFQCCRCQGGQFAKCKVNEKSTDFICSTCHQKYQVKAKRTTQRQIQSIKDKGVFKTIGGDYLTTLKNVHEHIDYFIILYETQSYKIQNILYVKNEDITPECIIPRKPLSASAQRAGWQGCQIVFCNLQTLV